MNTRFQPSSLVEYCNDDGSGRTTVSVTGCSCLTRQLQASFIQTRIETDSRIRYIVLTGPRGFYLIIGQNPSQQHKQDNTYFRVYSWFLLVGPLVRRKERATPTESASVWWSPATARATPLKSNMAVRICSLALLPVVAAFSPVTRRSFLQRSAATIGAATLPSGAFAASDEDLIDVYFGCGCFWHVQHEFVEAERKILGRSDSELSALAGYAGGLAGAKNGKVCYHNALQTSDYGSLGHAEAVFLRIPPSKFGAFAQEYCKLFDSKGNRPDQLGDRGTRLFIQWWLSLIAS